MKITESRLRRIIRDILKENDLQIFNQPSEKKSAGFVTPYRGNVSKEDLAKNFLEVIKVETSLYDIIYLYTEPNEEIPTVVTKAFSTIISAMYKKKFNVELNRSDNT